MDGFQKRRQNKKEAILTASLELFKEFGYNKVTVAEIAKELLFLRFQYIISLKAKKT